MTDTAYYYPAPYWGLEDSGWIKSLLYSRLQRSIKIFASSSVSKISRFSSSSLSFPLKLSM